LGVAAVAQLKHGDKEAWLRCNHKHTTFLVYVVDSV
jgi:hypothetical protein